MLRPRISLRICPCRKLLVIQAPIARGAVSTRARFNAAATVSGPVPPAISRVFMPSRGSSSRRHIPGVNSGANAPATRAFQSAGFFPAANAFQHQPAHDLMRLMERRAVARQRFGEIRRHHPAFFRGVGGHPGRKHHRFGDDRAPFRDSRSPGRQLRTAALCLPACRGCRSSAGPSW